MPTFDHARAQRNLRMLYLGHTGAGKTGSTVALAAAGWKVRILDIDNQVDVLEGYLTDTQRSIYRKAHPGGLWTQAQADTILSRMEYITVTEQYKIMGARSVPRGNAWQKINTQLTRWVDPPRGADNKPTEGEKNHGNISEWGPDTVLVIDGLSRLCEAAMNFQLSTNGRLLTGPQVGTAGTNDYSHAYGYIREFLNLLKSDEIRCHIIMICHIKFQEEDGADKSAKRNVKGFPQTVGRMLAPEIGQYFGHALRAKAIEQGQGVRRVIVTDVDESVDLKSSRPLAAKREYPLATGLAEYFRDLGYTPSTS